ncbi:hypothetical protein BDV38DRAFT_271133 [Aspergillus pseudotamarii]|uniref:4Fe-4S Mo/W bis-MGD-type domain-containing protein n=1 Tax=Aspergillus pseudotamarii TaxID=132259 RepID=A0A5N6SVI8_ASPPS|nr:uncharacterized protein BDV38DRAFT_271133 [Aspergillus pseudotamarii]KAE8137849.1 hypothetical protein BDV38DRAFT_271133 [Aspergillus pseudotamarii]
MAASTYESRDSIQDAYGGRTPYKHEWPTRLDMRVLDTPDKWVQSACVLCSNGCGLDIGVKDGRVVGRDKWLTWDIYSWESIHHLERLTHPLIRRNGKLERASWDEAMSLIVDKAKEIRQRLTNHGIGFYTSGQLFLEEYYVLAMIGKAGLNTLHMDGNTRLCTATAAASMRESFGSDGQPGSYGDIDYTECLFIVGHNVANTQTVLWSRILDRLDGASPPKLIVVDPRRSETAKKATIHLAPKIGTNMALLNGLQHLLFKNGWINEEFVSQHVVRLQQLEAVVEEYTPEYVMRITGVPTTLLEEAARIMGTSSSLVSTALQGVHQSNQATAAACQINNINLLLGHLGKPGSGILQMNGQPTAQNNREAGCDGEYPGFRNFQNPKHMQEIADHWNMFWVSGTNPLVSLPNLHRVRDLFTKPDLFLVVQDIFPTETTAVADVVLPAAQWAEKTGCFTNADQNMHLSQKAVEPPGEAKADLDIFLDFGRRMDFENKHGGPLIPYTTPEEVFDAWKGMSYGRPCDCSELTYEKLTGGSGIQWPCTKEYPNGKERLFTDGKFFTDPDYCEDFGHDLETGAPCTRAQYQAMNPAGRAILKAAHHKAPLEAPDDQFPLLLSTGRNVFHFHTRTKTGRARRLQQADPQPFVRISEADAKDLYLSEGEMVVVRSRRGSVELPVRIGEINEGHVLIPFHFGYFDSKDLRARAANELTVDEWDPVSKQPMFKSGAVRIEKCIQKEGGKETHSKEEQTAAIRSVEQKKGQGEMSVANAPKSQDPADERIRRLELWLGATNQALEVLNDIYKDLIPRLVHDLEVYSGLEIMRRITLGILRKFNPIISRYHESRQSGRKVAANLRDSLFPDVEEGSDAYEALVALQALDTFLTYIEGHLTALSPASQALWDVEFVDAVEFAQKGIQRQKAWVTQHIKVKSPQTLLVPVAAPGELHSDESTLSGHLRC